VQDRHAIDVLLVSPGTTAGWRRADGELMRILEELGVKAVSCTSDYRIARHFRRSVLTTDLAEAAAMRHATTRAVRRHRPRAIVYSSSQAAMLQPRSRLERAAIRFDLPAAVNRTGFGSGLLHALERRAVQQARVLLPWGLDAGAEAAVLARGLPVVPLPISIDAPVRNRPDRDPIALAYAGNPEKKGLDIVAEAWSRGAPEGWRLVVTGVDAAAGRSFLERRGVEFPTGVEWAGALEPDRYLELLGRASLFLSASRYEDYGLAQLEALAQGALLVTCPSEGRFEALGLQRELDPRLVAADCSPAALARALSVATSMSTEERLSLQKRARMHLQPYSRDEAKRRLSEEVLPLLLR
jgi:glycosyltransferase involved in cell wall biosynthesis